MKEKRALGEIKRTIYDSVFTDLFSDPKYQLRLYREMHPEDADVTEKDIRDVTIKTVMMDHIYNDLGFTVGSRMILLIQEQSIWCRNMALRTLLYLAETLKKYVVDTRQNYYSEKEISISRPELYVLYTGDAPYSDKTLSLADVHWDGDYRFLDLKVKVLYGDDGESVISQYASFTNVYKQITKQLGRTEEAVRRTIEYCIENDILADYFTERKTAASVTIQRP